MRFLLGWFSDNSTSTEVRPEKDPFTKRFDKCIRATKLLLLDPCDSGYQSFKSQVVVVCGDTLNVDLGHHKKFVEQWHVLGCISPLGVSAHGLVVRSPDGARLATESEAVVE
jgi:hypothetical protein